MERAESDFLRLLGGGGGLPASRLELRPELARLEESRRFLEVEADRFEVGARSRRERRCRDGDSRRAAREPCRRRGEWDRERSRLEAGRGEGDRDLAGFRGEGEASCFGRPERQGQRVSF